jgi:GntR family transcriptional regulator
VPASPEGRVIPGLRVNPTDVVPLWRQIEDGVRRLVAIGALPRGVRLPSVRDLARDLKVNPATVAKAYQRLTEAGVLTVRRGEGTEVAPDPPAMRRPERARALREAAQRYVGLAATLGATRGEALEAVSAAWPRAQQEERE